MQRTHPFLLAMLLLTAIPAAAESARGNSRNLRNQLAAAQQQASAAQARAADLERDLALLEEAARDDRAQIDALTAELARVQAGRPAPAPAPGEGSEQASLFACDSLLQQTEARVLELERGTHTRRPAPVDNRPRIPRRVITRAEPGEQPPRAAAAPRPAPPPPREAGFLDGLRAAFTRRMEPTSPYDFLRTQ